MLLEEFTGKKILITGGSGYIAKELTNQLSQHRNDIILVSRVPHLNNNQFVNCRVSDLKSSHAWEELISDVDVVFHLSAQTDLSWAEKNPKRDYIENVLPIKKLIEAAKKKNVTKMKVVLASTATIFGLVNKIPVDESFSDAPISVYDRHKLLNEIALKEATGRGELKACSLRIANVYGYGTPSKNLNRGILNVMMRKALKGEEITCYEGNQNIRDFIHITDVISAFCHAGFSDKTGDGQSYIIASGKGYSLYEAFQIIAKRVSHIIKRDVKIISTPEPKGLHPIETRNFVGNSALFREKTNWSPVFELDKGILEDIKKYSKS